MEIGGVSKVLIPVRGLIWFHKLFVYIQPAIENHGDITHLFHAC